MGKYMRKAKITADVAVMEVSQSSLGVRTRAKSLALQRLQTAATPPDSESSYLQLRSRRLEKPPWLKDSQKNQQQHSTEGSCRQGLNPDCASNPRASSRLRLSSVDSGSVGSISVGCSKKERDGFPDVTTTATVASKEDVTEDKNDFGIEASFGENNLDFEGRGRSTRESTPCSFVRDSETIGTPGSTTRPVSSAIANRRIQNAVSSIPTMQELEEFFASAEQEQRSLFTEKYNFDFLNELPLPGRYEWVRVDP